ncbi:MAG: hypothetical protein ABR584_01760 [Candidatus Baltobacteraceae bacterium]
MLLVGCGGGGDKHESSTATTTTTTTSTGVDTHQSAELADVNAVITTLNGSTDGQVIDGAAFDSDGGALVVKIDTDKLSTDQDQTRTMHLLETVYAKTYRQHHGGKVDKMLQIRVEDLAGTEVKSDAIYADQ